MKTALGWAKAALALGALALGQAQAQQQSSIFYFEPPAQQQPYLGPQQPAYRGPFGASPGMAPAPARASEEPAEEIRPERMARTPGVGRAQALTLADPKDLCKRGTRMSPGRGYQMLIDCEPRESILPGAKRLEGPGAPAAEIMLIY